MVTKNPRETKFAFCWNRFSKIWNGKIIGSKYDAGNNLLEKFSIAVCAMQTW